MPYSLDPEANKENAMSPSLNISLNEQFIYRLASLESTLREGFKHLDEKFEALNKDTAARRMELARELETFKAETHISNGKYEARIDVLEKWQTAMTVRFSLILAGVIIFWTIFGPAVRGVLGIANG